MEETAMSQGIRQLPEAGKGKGQDSPWESHKNCGRANPSISAGETSLDFCSPQLENNKFVVF